MKKKMDIFTAILTGAEPIENESAVTMHTPAPWKVNPDGDPRTKYRVYAGKSLVCDADGALPSDENAANARLISFSPAMFDVIKALVNCPDYDQINTIEMNAANDIIREIEGFYSEGDTP